MKNLLWLMQQHAAAHQHKPKPGAAFCNVGAIFNPSSILQTHPCTSPVTIGFES
jgi:hypothetical protein